MADENPKIDAGAGAAPPAVLPVLPAIPDDAGLDAMSDGQLFDLAGSRGIKLSAPDRAEALGALRQARHEDEQNPAAPVASAAQANDALAEIHGDGDWDPRNPREFDPNVVQLHLERDGIVVEGPINPFTGEGTDDLLVRLQDMLVIARSREDGAAPAHDADPAVEAPDPNGLKRQRAIAAGHDIDPDAHRCRNCHAAEWYCLTHNEPCVPRTDSEAPAPTPEPEHGETDQPAA